MRRVVLAMVSVVVAVGQGATAEAVTLPAGFVDEPVATVGAPTALAFTPDRRLLIATQAGELRVRAADGTLLATPALSLGPKLCANAERGLLGVAVDPAFASNRFIYLYYTFNAFAGACAMASIASPVNRVSRFVLADTNVVDPASETVLIDNIASFAGTHNGGDLQFGKDGDLYVSVGDGGCHYSVGTCAAANTAALEPFTLLGKILRITPSGQIPADNPWQGLGTARCNVTGAVDPSMRCQETFASGLRNPFRIAFDPNAAGTRFYINDVGQALWEEIDEAVAGADYGWNVREGHCANGSTTDCGPPPPGLTNPIFDYGRSDGCGAITGGAFVPAGAWPAAYDGAYLFADYTCGRIFRLAGNGSGAYSRLTFADSLGTDSAVHLVFGPHPTAGTALYYTTYAGGGAVRRIAFVGANAPPLADMTASPVTGYAPLAVTFDGSASSDPDGGDTLTYLWDFGDGAAIKQTASATTSHTYTTSATFTARLTVRDNHGAVSTPDLVRIDVARRQPPPPVIANTPPVPRIESPVAGHRFAVGETIALQGSALDAQDGSLPARALTWTVVRRRGGQTRPHFGPFSGNGASFNGPAPEDLAATTKSSIEVRLTATDSAGASTTVTRTLAPQLVKLSFTTKPSKLKLTLNGKRFTTPRTWISWEGWKLTIDAPTQGRRAFRTWSDGGARKHVIRTPATPATYGATFRSR